MDDLAEIIDKLNNIEEVKTMFIESVKEHEKKYEQIGMQKGEKKGLLKTAKRLLAMGAEYQFIVDATGLSLDEIKRLQEN